MISSTFLLTRLLDQLPQRGLFLARQIYCRVRKSADITLAADPAKNVSTTLSSARSRSSTLSIVAL